MNFEVFIARGLLSGKRYSFSKPVIRIIIFSIALGLSAVLLSVSILFAYKSALIDNMSGFAGHIRVAVFDGNNSYESLPVELDTTYMRKTMEVAGVRSVNPVAYKSGILKSGDEVEGLIIKGIDGNYDACFLRKNLLSGKMPCFSSASANDSVILSKTTARRLQLRVNDKVKMFFFDDKITRIRGRKFVVAGIFETGLEQFDRKFLIGDIRHVQKLNHWNSKQISTYEIKIEDFKQIREIERKLIQFTDYEYDVRRIDELYPAMFQWLKLHNKNVEVIILLVSLIASITMISLLLILILEHIPHIGILKALGCSNACVRNIFILEGAYIVGQALLYGNMFSLLFIWLQEKYHFIPLNKDSYYISYVPVEASWTSFLLINAGALLLTFLVLLVPSFIVVKIKPLRAIRFS